MKPIALGYLPRKAKLGFEESKHPRNNGGEFTDGSGGGAPSAPAPNQSPKPSGFDPSSHTKDIPEKSDAATVADTIIKNKMGLPYRVMKEWIDGNYEAVNQNPDSPYARTAVAVIGKIAPTPMQSSLHLFRGLSFKSTQERDAFVSKIGGDMEFPNPIQSATPDREIAQRFQDGLSLHGRSGLMIEITSSKSGRNIKPISEKMNKSLAHEDEFVFLKGSKFKVEGKSVVNGVPHIKISEA